MKKLVASLVLLSVLGCKSRSFNSNDNKGRVKDLGTEQSIADDGKQTTGDKLGLAPDEIALTLDDGPVPESYDIAKWLSDEGIPVTYFMIGKNVNANMSTAMDIAKLPNVIISNHSWDHKRKNNDVACVACDGAQYAADEIKDADDALQPVYKANKPAFYFFRAPGGNFFLEGKATELADLDEVNRQIGSKYVGPVRWDVDGDVNPVPAGCAHNYDTGGAARSASSCKDFYMDQIHALKGAGIVILAHDVHQDSRDMIKLLVQDLKSEGYKFVALDKNKTAVAALGKVKLDDSTKEFGTTSFSTADLGSASYKFEIKAPGADHIEVWVDRKNDAPLFAGSGDILSQTYTFSSTGTRFFTIKGFDASGKLMAQKMRTMDVQK